MPSDPETRKAKLKADKALRDAPPGTPGKEEADKRYAASKETRKAKSMSNKKRKSYNMLSGAPDGTPRKEEVDKKHASPKSPNETQRAKRREISALRARPAGTPGKADLDKKAAAEVLRVRTSQKNKAAKDNYSICLEILGKF